MNHAWNSDNRSPFGQVSDSPKMMDPMDWFTMGGVEAMPDQQSKPGAQDGWESAPALSKLEGVVHFRP